MRGPLLEPAGSPSALPTAIGWNAEDTELDDEVMAIAVSGSDVYAGGLFRSVGGNAANRIARYEAGPSVCTSTGSGDWINPATWGCGHVPGPGEAVVIAAGHTVTLDQDVALDSNLDMHRHAHRR